MRVFVLIVVSGLILIQSGSSDASAKMDTKVDLERFQGVWTTGKGVNPSVRLEVHKRGLGLRYLVKNNNVVVELLDMDVFELKEAKDIRSLELTELAAVLFKTGRRIEYKFDHDTIELKVLEGDLKGNHKLTKVATKK